MEVESLIGFALVFVLLSWTISLLGGLIVRLAERPLRDLGSCAERTAAAGALTIAPTLSAALTVLLMCQSFAGVGSTDHCLVHDHHPHLCLYHGGGWAEIRWAVLTLGALFVMFAARVAERIRSASTARVARRVLEQAGKATADGIVLITADSAFCFATGFWQPRIFVSTAAWERLDDAERQAVLAHEEAHIRQGDVWRRYGLGILGVFGAPFSSARLLEIWKHATERLCDRRAAQTVGDHAVASALLKLARAGEPGSFAFANAFITGSNVVDRVETVLRDEPEGVTASRWLVAAIGGFVLTAIAIGVVYVDPLHHTLETLLGII